MKAIILNFEIKQALAQRFEQTRALTESLLAHLSEEDQCVQSMPDASPAKWHLGHTTWFFETVVLSAHCPNYKIFNPQFSYLFNSYYESLGPRQPRPQRGLLTRPALAEVMEYRAHITQALLDALLNSTVFDHNKIAYLIELGIHHEQQHQELIVTDALHLFSCNPLLPKSGLNLTSYKGLQDVDSAPHWIQFDAGLSEFGQASHQFDYFSFDNEQPRHQRWLETFEISSQLVTCGEYLAFIQDGGYQNSAYWLSEGWAWLSRTGQTAPAYWLAPHSALNATPNWHVFGVDGANELALNKAVTHLSFFEADAFAQWSGARLPTEFEWERTFNHSDMHHMLGQAWQWTRSAYEPYPGFKPWDGAIREYNGKFMVGQQVLRGSSWATPSGHARNTYRNFFAPHASWQITGLRLARDLA